MKLKIYTILIAIFGFGFCHAQNKTETSKNDVQKELKNISTTKKYERDVDFSEKEWKKMLKQIKKNKKKIGSRKNKAFLKNVMDTVFIEIPNATRTANNLPLDWD